MTDLFGEQELQIEAGFAEFWAAWPVNIRKVAKRQCLEKWVKHRLSAQSAHIIAHVEWMKTQEEWQKNNGAFVCAPMVYINQERWSEWKPEPARPKQKPAIEIIKEHVGDKCRPEHLQRLKELRAGRAQA